MLARRSGDRIRDPYGLRHSTRWGTFFCAPADTKADPFSGIGLSTFTSLNRLLKAGDRIRTGDVQLGKKVGRSRHISICARFKRLTARLVAPVLTGKRRIEQKCDPM